MSLINQRGYTPGDQHIPANKINALQDYVKRTRRHSQIRHNGMPQKQSMREEGADIDIDGYPMLYRVVSTSEGAEQSSSSSGSGADIEVSVKRVDASTGTTYGPALRVKVIE